MKREATFEQIKMINELREGDKVLLTDGSSAEFVRAKRSKFIGIINNTRYDIPFTMLKEIKEKINPEEKYLENLNRIQQLKRDDWFYIVKDDDCIVFKFVEVKAGKIIGINPNTNSRTKIDQSFKIGFIK